MATFPTGVASLTNPVSSDKMNVVPHATQHANANDEIEAIETALTGAFAATAQGAIPYVASVGVLAALAAGTAGQVLTSGGAAANPSWTAKTGLSVAGCVMGGMDVTHITYDISTTGLGFTPKSIQFMYAKDGSIYASWGMTVGTAANQSACIASPGVSGGTVSTFINSGYQGQNIAIYYPDNSNYVVWTIKSFDADGFTITQTKTGSPTGNGVMSYLAHG